MKTPTRLVTVVGFAMILGGCTAPDDPAVSEEALNGAQDPPGARVYRAKGGGHGGGGGSGAQLLTWHGGPVLHTNSTEAIFWGSEWSSASFAGDKITGLDTFFGGLGGSELRRDRRPSTAARNGTRDGARRRYLGHAFDTTAAPRQGAHGRRAPSPRRARSPTTTRIANARLLHLHVDGRGPRQLLRVAQLGHLLATARPSRSRTCRTSTASPAAIRATPRTGHSQGLAALANVTSHELLRGDHRPARHAAGSTPAARERRQVRLDASTAPCTLANGSTWKLQMEWSNAAYNGGTGFANLSGENGCIQGN